MQALRLARWLVPVTVLAPLLPAQVSHLELIDRRVVADGAEFGAIGSYEVVEGRLHFALDPTSPFNARIVDLGLAPRNAQGRVETVADFVALQPVDPTRRSGTALLEVSNRGGKATLGAFCRGRGGDFDRRETFGDGLLMERGVTVVWCGWQWDVPHEPGRLRLRVPTLHAANGAAIEGRVRSDRPVDEPTRAIPLGDRGHVPYPPVRPGSEEHVLTRRDGRDAPREVVSRSTWQFRDDLQAIEPTGDEPFAAGFIYELVYTARDPVLVGAGLAAIRDCASWLKHGEDNPLHGIDRVVAVGISQTGRFLRQFVWQGFTTDTENRRSLDGVYALTAGAGRGSFNHRFAQPSRDGHRYSAFCFPTDIYPFTSTLQHDPVTGRIDGLFARQHDPDHLPKCFWTNTGYEYWGRGAALIHSSITEPLRDVPPTGRERVYHIASAQHFQGNARNNPMDLQATWRALLVALLDWVDDGTMPPDSRHPTLADGTLVPLADLVDPKIPGLTLPTAIQTAYRADYGAHFLSEGIVDFQPPRLGPEFPSLVPSLDALGHERGGIQSLELRVPLATYTGFSLREGLPGGNGELADFTGRFLPLPRDADSDDPRPALATLYRDRDDYLGQLRAGAAALVAERLLLAQDVEESVRRGAALWDLVHH